MTGKVSILIPGLMSGFGDKELQVSMTYRREEEF
jgi:hypothetical protein